MSRERIESAPHPMPCEHCGRATRVLLNGKRTCYLCLGTVKERKSA